MLGVPMIDGRPVERSAEILLHLADQIAGEAAQVRHLQGVVRRDDEAEMMAVILAAAGEILRVHFLATRTEQVRLFPIPGDALAAQIIEMSAERRIASAVADHARLDDGAA